MLHEKRSGIPPTTQFFGRLGGAVRIGVAAFERGAATPLAVGTLPALNAAVLMDPYELQVDHPRWVPVRWPLADSPQYVAAQAD